MWKIEERGSWLKSLDTRGSSVKPRIFFSSPFADSFIMLLISSTEVDLEALNLKSTTDTFWVGTLTETPSNYPFNSGKTNPTAFAAPVEVGIIFPAAALDL